MSITPTTKEIRETYAWTVNDFESPFRDEKRLEEFDHWLAEYKRKVSKRVWEEGHAQGRDNERELFRLMALNGTSEGAQLHNNPYLGES